MGVKGRDKEGEEERGRRRKREKWRGGDRVEGEGSVLDWNTIY